MTQELPKSTTRAPTRSFRELIVWQKAHEFVLAVYQLTEGFPSKELYSLTNQFRRAAVSVPANIVEGYRKRTKADKIKYLNIAQGSLEEARYYLILSHDLGYGNSAPLLPKAEEVSKLLDAYLTGILSPVS